ncbi:MAG: S-methyl-5-thioribose-1-phosphate isomerase [Candidatus Omnitrophica bacterium]|nr:S-methyl-5-thioribose-1-phosphate isomerase [Candidatus Omnitrophota bacterium]
MDFKTIEWKNNKIKMIDQTQLPQKLVYLHIDNLKTLWQAIKEMKVRGAPALGAAAGLGVYLGVKDSKAGNFNVFKKELERVIDYIGSSRPTARNLFWALEKCRLTALKNKGKPVAEIKEAILGQARQIMCEDSLSCNRIGSYGAKLIKNNDSILTICNAGALATIDFGTALGVIYRAKQDEKNIKVYACETRPMLQGARLTTWELSKKGIDVTLICDSMAATLMRQGKVNKVIAGADRIASNGDTANKIGTYNLAVLSRYHKIPFYIAAPASTFDLNIKSGKQIPIEERPAWEVTELFFKKPTAAKGVKVFNPAFDVTPAELISAIITDKGVISPPYAKNISKIIKK